ncbi:MAG: cystathionine beta-lyase/cystathionine gamma-synthase [Cyclobacteriaceae bacterium]|jgi:cystathionine beta-lyase/cystathionine gamma-synthase
MQLDYIINHLGEGKKTEAIPASPPIYQTSNFIFNTSEEMKAALAAENEIPFYTRGANPTVDLLQMKMAALENAEKCLMFASGSAAISAAILSQVKAGDHIVCVQGPYSWTKKLLVNILSRFNVTHSFVKSDSQSIASAIRDNTKLIYLESPNSWTYEMQDLEEVSLLAKKSGIRTIVDNSFASPLFQRPLDYGIDIVVHSATKYLGGHSDVVAGALCASLEIIEEIFKGEYMTLGGIISPFDAWLMLRSLRTLPLRLEKVVNNTKIIMPFLESHEKISAVFSPLAQSFPQPELAKKYLKQIGGLVTIDLKTNDLNKIKSFCDTLERFKLGCSWGSYESLAFPAFTTMDSMNYQTDETIINRIRLYIGLDDPETLMEDLNNSLAKI